LRPEIRPGGWDIRGLECGFEHGHQAALAGDGRALRPDDRQHVEIAIVAGEAREKPGPQER
jgi:hypothetical protein